MSDIESVTEAKAECFHGWSAENGNLSGQCCCNCRWSRPIAGHPWNKVPAFHGRISTVIAWGCTVPELPNITLTEHEHSMCEMHERKI